jgi:hypothetical protein
MNDFQDENYNFKKLTTDVIPRHPVCVWSGSRRTGKTTMYRYLMYLMHYSKHSWDAVYVMCGSASTRLLLAKNCPPYMMVDHFDPGKLMNLMETQERKIEAGEPVQDILIVLDDLGFDKKKLNASVPLAKAFKNGRHARMTVFMTTHSALEMECGLRENVDITFFPGSYINKKKVMQKIHEHYCSSFPTFGAFVRGYRTTTTCRSWLAVITDPDRTAVSDCIFWLRAHAHKDPVTEEMHIIVDKKKGHNECFKIGRKAYWDVWRRYQKKTRDPSRAPVAPAPKPALRAYPGGPEIQCVGNEEDLKNIEDEQKRAKGLRRDDDRRDHRRRSEHAFSRDVVRRLHDRRRSEHDHDRRRSEHEHDRRRSEHDRRRSEHEHPRKPPDSDPQRKKEDAQRHSTIVQKNCVPVEV